MTPATPDRARAAAEAEDWMFEAAMEFMQPGIKAASEFDADLGDAREPHYCAAMAQVDKLAAIIAKHAPASPSAAAGGADLIAAERRRQIEAEGWDVAHDDEHDAGEMALAAACYATPIPLLAEVIRQVPCNCREAGCPHVGMTAPATTDPWPWSEEWDKRRKHDRLRQLVIAGALIAAEIDRLKRAAGATP